MFTKFSSQQISYLFLILLPPALVSGPAIPDIIMTLIGLIFIYQSIQQRLWHFYLHPMSILFFAFYTIILLSASLSEMPWTSLIERESLFYIRFYIFSLAICYLAQKMPSIFKYLALSLLATIIVIVIDGSIEYFTGTSLFGVHSGDTRLFSLFIDEAIVGRYIASATMLCVALLIYYYGYEKYQQILLIFAVLMIGEVFTFMTGERAALGMIAAYSLMAFVLISQRRFERFIFILISILFIGALIQNEDRSQRRYVQTVNELNERHYPFVLASPGHEKHYKSTVLMFKDNPIFGIGSNLYRHVCEQKKYHSSDKSPCTTHPHHYYFQILGENGLLGFSLLFGFLLFLVFFLSRHFLGLISFQSHWMINDRHLLFYIFLFAMICPLWPSGSFYHNWTNIPLYLGLGFFLSLFLGFKIKNE